MSIIDLQEEHRSLYENNEGKWNTTETIGAILDDIEETYRIRSQNADSPSFNNYDVFYLNGRSVDNALSDDIYMYYKPWNFYYIEGEEKIEKIKDFTLDGKLLMECDLERVLKTIYDNPSDEILCSKIIEAEKAIKNIVGTNFASFYELGPKNSITTTRIGRCYQYLILKGYYILIGDYCILITYGNSE